MPWSLQAVQLSLMEKNDQRQFISRIFFHLKEKRILSFSFGNTNQDKNLFNYVYHERKEPHEPFTLESTAELRAARYEILRTDFISNACILENKTFSCKKYCFLECFIKRNGRLIFLGNRFHQIAFSSLSVNSYTLYFAWANFTPLCELGIQENTPHKSRYVRYTNNS